MAFLKLFSQFSKRAPVVCLTGLLLLFTSSTQPVGACDCARISSVKANMHTLQTMLETFYADHHYYPPHIHILETHAQRSPQPYWIDFNNPFISKTGYFKSFCDYQYLPFDQQSARENFVNILGIKMIVTQKKSIIALSGLVVYAPVSPQQYFLYGLDKEGKMILDKGQVFSLSNS